MLTLGTLLFSNQVPVSIEDIDPMSLVVQPIRSGQSFLNTDVTKTDLQQSSIAGASGGYPSQHNS